MSDTRETTREVGSELATACARTYRKFLAAFIGQRFDDEPSDRMNLGMALDHLEEASAIILSLAATRVTSAPGLVTGPDEHGSVYVYFQNRDDNGVAKKTVQHAYEVNVDYDEDGDLFGIEILGVADHIETHGGTSEN